jgi:hypothetical protein
MCRPASFSPSPKAAPRLARNLPLSWAEQEERRLGIV